MNKISEARKIFDQYKRRHKVVGEFIDFNNFINMYTEYMRDDEEFVDALVDEIIDRINSDKVKEALRYQLEEHEYDIKNGDFISDGILGLLQEEVIHGLYHEFRHPHLKHKNQNMHIRKEARKRLKGEDRKES